MTNCNYDHTCHFNFTGRLNRSDLYGTSGLPSNFTVSGALAPAVMTLGSTSHVHGSVSPSSAGKTVSLQRYYSGAWHAAGSQALSSSSAYSFTSKPGARGVYRYRVYKPAAGSVAAGYSRTTDLYVGVYRVTDALSPTAMHPGGTAKMTGRVAPVRSGQRVYLQRYYSSAWHSLSAYALTSNSGYTFAIKINTVGTYTYRVYKPADATYASGYSPSRVVKVA